MPILTRRRKFRPSRLQHGGNLGIVPRFDLERPMRHSNRTMDTDEYVTAGPQDPPVWGVKFDDEPWVFFREQSEALRFRRDRVANR